MGFGRPPLFKGAQANATTIAVPVTIVAGCIGLHVSWPDAATAASFILDLSSFSSDDAPLGAGGAGTQQPGNGTAVLAGASPQLWPDSGIVITPVTAGAAGSFMLHETNVRAKRARLRITATGTSFWEIYSGITDV